MRYRNFLKLIVLLAIFIFFSFIPLVCFSAVYYVDHTYGSDTNDGLSQIKALKTLDKVLKLSLSSGDQVLLKRGEKWRGKIKCTVSGQDNNRILFGAYGEGENPVIENIVKIKAWQAKDKGIYSCAIGNNWCYGFFEDGKKVKEASSSVLTDGRWYFDGQHHLIYYKPESTILPICYYSPSYYLLLLERSSYITVENITFQYSGGGIVVNGGGHVKITNCEIDYIYEQGITFLDTKGYCEAINNSINKCGDGIYFMNKCQGHNNLSGNMITYCNYNEYNNNDGHAIGIQNCSNNIITSNELSYCITPIAIWADVGFYANDNVIAYNQISNCKKQYKHSYNGKGIAICPEEDNHATGNIVHHNIIRSCNFGLKFTRSNNSGNVCYNNVFDNCGIAVILSKGCDNAEFINNIFFNSDTYHIMSEHSNNGANNVFSHNCYFPDIINGYVDRSKVLRNFAVWKAATGFDKKSFVADPMFKGVGDYHHQAGSPCIGTGKNLISKFSENLDFSRKQSYSDGVVDIGVYKYVSTHMLVAPSNIHIK